MKTLALTLAAVACACVVTLVVMARPHRATASALRADLLDDIAGVRTETWQWQSLIGMRKTHAEAVAPTAGLAYQRWVLRLWRRRAAQVRRLVRNPPHKKEFLCIHRYEGSWTDGGAPYYGGLQMDISFQRHYGPHLLRRKGTADNWTPLEQIWVAERAHRSGLGFTPWPNTARACGLL